MMMMMARRKKLMTARRCDLEVTAPVFYFL